MLPFSLPGFSIDAVQTHEEKLVVDASAIRPFVSCPDCRATSARIHSWYVRSPRDVPVTNQFVRLRLRVRRFFCDHPGCARRTFAERLPDLVPFRAQRTQRLSQSLQVLGFALGGRAAARTAERLYFQTSRSTLLRVVHRTVLPEHPTPRVLGIDDFALRKGHVYGTILVDLEHRRPVDLLPDRDAELVEAWFHNHPGVQIVSRDRSTEYRRGITAGAPTAIQVADRWHILANLRDALERVLTRVYRELRERIIPLPEASTTDSASLPTLRVRQRSRLEEAAKVARRERRFARYHDIRTRYEQGTSMRTIAKELHLSQGVVRRFLRSDMFPERAPSRRRARLLLPFEPTLHDQWRAGERNVMALLRAIQVVGYSGSAQTIRRWVQERRQEPAPRTNPKYRASYTVPAEQVAQRAAGSRPLASPRQLVWLLLGERAQLPADEAFILEQLVQEPTIDTAYKLGQQFLEIVRWRQHDQFDTWLAACETSAIADLKGFAIGLRQDEAAIRAALTLPWSNGQVEGQNTRLKLLKRQMYGKASFELLRKRVLYAA